MKLTDWSLLAEQLHAAALDGQGWEPALQSLADATGSRSVQLCGIEGSRLLFNMITNIDPAMTRILAKTAATNPRVPVANTVPVLRTMADGDFLTPEEHRHHPFYREVCVPWDVPYICLTALQRTDDTSVILAAIRSKRNGHISTRQRAKFARLARHVQSAVGLQVAIERKGAAFMAGALEALQCSAFICDHRGYIRAMTPAAERLVSGGTGLSLRGRVLRGPDETSTRQLHDCIRAAGERRAAVDRFCKRTVRVPIGQAGLATVEIFALPGQPYELPFWPTVLVVVREEVREAPGALPEGETSTLQPSRPAAFHRRMHAESMLDSLNCAAFMVDHARRVVHHNLAATALLKQHDGLQLRDQRLHTTDPMLDARLQSLIGSASGASGERLIGAIALPRPSGRRPLQVTVRAVRPADPVEPAPVWVLIGDPDKSAHLPETVLSALYGLTRAEVEIANALLSGSTVAGIAQQRRVTGGTMRMQLKSIFQKTHTRRQSDLLKLLLSLPTHPSDQK